MAILKDPTTIVITPSPTAGVTSYILTFTSTDGTSQPPLPYNCGLPPMNDSGLYEIPMDQARQGSTALGPFTLTAIAMAGTLQSSASQPTAEFNFTAPIPPVPPAAPAALSLTGGHYPRP